MLVDAFVTSNIGLALWGLLMPTRTSARPSRLPRRGSETVGLGSAVNYPGHKSGTHAQSHLTGTIRLIADSPNATALYGSIGDRFH